MGSHNKLGNPEAVFKNVTFRESSFGLSENAISNSVFEKVEILLWNSRNCTQWHFDENSFFDINLTSDEDLCDNMRICGYGHSGQSIVSLPGNTTSDSANSQCQKLRILNQTQFSPAVGLPSLHAKYI